MKKFLAALAIVAVMGFGIVGALAVIPHTHGKDFNHSQHQTCPVYQFGISNVHADVSHVDFIVALFIFCFLIEFQKSVPVFFTRSLTHPRAPPAIS